MTAPLPATVPSTEEGEVAALPGQTMALELSDAHGAVRSARTEVWIAGLQRAAISLQGHQKPEEFIRSFTASHRFLQDFQLEEVPDRQSLPVERFGLPTAVLDRLCPALCEAVMQDDDDGSMLACLERAKRLTVPLTLAAQAAPNDGTVGP